MFMKHALGKGLPVMLLLSAAIDAASFRDSTTFVEFWLPLTLLDMPFAGASRRKDRFDKLLKKRGEKQSAS